MPGTPPGAVRPHRRARRPAEDRHSPAGVRPGSVPGPAGMPASGDGPDGGRPVRRGERRRSPRPGPGGLPAGQPRPARRPRRGRFGPALRRQGARVRAGVLDARQRRALPLGARVAGDGACGAGRLGARRARSPRRRRPGRIRAAGPCPAAWRGRRHAAATGPGRRREGARRAVPAGRPEPAHSPRRATAGRGQRRAAGAVSGGDATHRAVRGQAQPGEGRVPADRSIGRGRCARCHRGLRPAAGGPGGAGPRAGAACP